MHASSLHLDWCGYAAARHACENWHYSGCMPPGKTVKIGVWEHGRFVGVVIFSRGASPTLLRRYGLTQAEGCELTRVALREHRTPTTRIVAIALRMLKRHCPGMRLVVSFADPMQDHVGVIYQAGGWLYTGTSKPNYNFVINGRVRHRRFICAVAGGGPRRALEWVRERLDPDAGLIPAPGKYRYLMPLDPAMRERVAALTRPYPKRAKGSRPSGASPLATGRCDSDPHAPTLMP